MSSDVVMIKERGKWQEQNAKLLHAGVKQTTGVYRTHKVLIFGFLFGKHATYEALEHAFWSLINPEQTRYVSLEQVHAFLKDLQSLAIDVPAQTEDLENVADNILISYFRNI